MTKKIAFVFPGQGSQCLEMLADCKDHPIVVATLNEANDALGYDLASIILNGPLEKLNQTEITQPALLTVSIALYRLWVAENNLRPVLLAGHSLGEYSALVAANAIEFKDAISLVSLRGQAMQAAVPLGMGAMAAILGLEDADVIRLCEETSEGEVLEAVNFNSPGQVVIAGTSPAVARACVKAKEMGAKRALLLPVSAPSHCELMRPAAEKLAVALEAVLINKPIIAVIHNVDVCVWEQSEAIKNALVAQLFKPVRWHESVASFQQYGVTDVVECGPGKVLTGLVKRIDKTLNCYNIHDLNSLQQVSAAIGITE